MPQQMPQQMARGGLASIRIDPRMFDYGSGGVVSFAGDTDGSLAQVGEGFPAGGIDDEEGNEQPVLTTEQLRALRARLEGRLGQAAPTLDSAAVVRKNLEERNQYGVDPGPVGQKYLAGLDTIQQYQVAEDAKIKEDNDRLKNIGISRALIRAGEGTRGGGGIAGLLGAFGESYAGVQEEDIKRAADLRGRDLTRAGVLNEATYAIQKLREAQRSGDEKGVMEQNQKLADLANKLNISQNELMGKLFASETNLLKAKIAAGKGKSPTDLASGVEEGLRAARASGDTRNEDVIRKEVRNALITAGVAVTAGAAIAGQGTQAETATAERDRKVAEAVSERNRKIQADAADNLTKILDDPRSLESRKLNELRRADRAFNNPPEPLIGAAPPKPAVPQDTAGDYKKQLMREQVAELNRTTPAVVGAAPAAAGAAPAAPAGAAAAAPAAATTYPVPNAGAINALKSNQGSPEQFDAIFGPGAAKKILGK